jgi:hypothetical protein
MILIPLEQALSYKCNQIIPFTCDFCQCEFERTRRQIKLKTNQKHFCCRDCHQSSREKSQISLECKNCKQTFYITQSDFNHRIKKTKDKLNLFCSKQCANENNTFRSEIARKKVSETLKQRGLLKRKNKVCRVCSKEFFSKTRKTTCSSQCYKQLLPSIGQRGGMKTSSLEFHKRNRSSNEKSFFNKIKELFPDARANQRIFNGWDADIVIPSIKLAIHWNGAWHYEVVINEELFKKVQSKDQLRYKAIENNGYKNYIIQDLGRINNTKVEKEYLTFIEYIKHNKNERVVREGLAPST